MSSFGFRGFYLQSNNMKILVIGSGGREHAICWKFSQNENVEKVYCANGNAGIGEIAQHVDIKPEEISKLADFALTQNIDLTFVGGETPLALGIVDEFEKCNLKIVGVSRQAARLEASKAFSKHFMRRHEIPTAAYKVADSIEEAKNILLSGEFGDENAPVVVKADGLAAGKGVIVAGNRSQAVSSLEDLTKIAGNAASKIVLEECLEGREVSLLLFADGKNFSLMPPARDHKRIGENDTGANTGGMGVITGKELLTEDETAEIIEKVIKPTLTGAKNEGFQIKGILFLGLMLTRQGVKVLEYNVRFGDPETQAILVRLETDLVEICDAILNQTLDKIKLKWKEENSACVVLAAHGYPQKTQIGDVIHGLEKAAARHNVTIFHSGTARNENGNFITSGGRVLSVTATGNNLTDAINYAYEAVNEINWEGMQFRRDIGGYSDSPVIIPDKTP